MNKPQAIIDERPIEEIVDEADRRGLFEVGTLYASEDISNELYHAGPGLGSTQLKNALKSPAHYITHKKHPKKSTKDMQFGTWLHELVLEPHVFEATYVAAPFKDFRSKAAAKFRAEKLADGMYSIPAVGGDDEFWDLSDWDRLHRIRDAIMEHEFAKLFFNHSVYETTGYWFEDVALRDKEDNVIGRRNVKCKVRFDIRDLAHFLIVDIKTTKDASFSSFIRSVFDFGYHISCAHYMRGAEELGLDATDFVLLAVEKEPPFAIGIYELDGDAKHIGEMQRKRAMETIVACQEANEWPCFNPEPRPIATPSWLKRTAIS